MPGKAGAETVYWNWSDDCDSLCNYPKPLPITISDVVPGSSVCIVSFPYTSSGYSWTRSYFVYGVNHPGTSCFTAVGSSVTISSGLQAYFVPTNYCGSASGHYCITRDIGTRNSGVITYTKIVPGVCNGTIPHTCDSGDLTGVADTDTSYIWSCKGNTGVITPCPAMPKPINAVCDLATLNCSPGSYYDITDVNYVSKWGCNGLYGGTSLTCEKPQVLAGVCTTTIYTIGCNVGNNVDLYTTATDPAKYKWKCTGINGGATTSCSMFVPIPGACSDPLANNGCAAGSTWIDAQDDDIWYRWTCRGLYGSDADINTPCSKKKPVDGVCSLPLVINTCAAGLLDDLADTDTEYRWNCNGRFGSLNNAYCFQAIPPAPSGLLGSCQASTGLINLSWNEMATGTHYIVKADKQDSPTNLWQDDCSLTDNPGDRCLEIEPFIYAYEHGGPTMIPVPGDYNGDGIDDLALWNPATGKWTIRDTVTKNYIVSYTYVFGSSGMIPVPGDYNNDGKADLALWNPTDGKWYIQDVVTKAFLVDGYAFGYSTSIPVPGDYDGNGIDDLALWNPSDGIWYIRNAYPNHWLTVPAGYVFGSPTMIPVPGDYNKDGKADLVLWNPLTGIWYGRNADANHWLAIKPAGYVFGSPTMIPAPGDYNGDGKTDLALRETDGTWYIQDVVTKNWLLNGYAQGNSSWIPAPGDYNGDGVDDLAFWRPSDASWFIKSFFTDNSYSFTTSTTTLPVNYKWSVQAVTNGVLSHETLGTDFSCSNGAAGVCGSTLNQCAVGTTTNITTTSEQQKWSCTGVSGGATTSCSQLIPALSMPCEATSITLSWATTTNATSYRVYKNGTSTSNRIATTTAPTHNINSAAVGDTFFVSSVISSFESGMTTGASIPKLSAPNSLILNLGEINNGDFLSPNKSFDFTVSASAQNPANQYLKMDFRNSINGIDWSLFSSYLLNDKYSSTSTNPVTWQTGVTPNPSFTASDQPGKHTVSINLSTYPVCNIVDYSASNAWKIASADYTVSGVVCGTAVGGKFVDFPSQTACPAGSTFIDRSDDGTNWNWKCQDTGGSVSGPCIATKISALDPILTCSVAMTPPVNPVMINTNTIWTATPTVCPTCKINWNIVDANGTTTSSVATTTLNQTFTTIGEKQVVARVASTTDDVYGPPCSATTSVTRTGGTIIER